MRAARWTLPAAAGAAFAAFALLIGRWSAEPALGWTLAAAAFALGAAAGARGPAPDEDGVRAWSVAGSLAALAVPALLRAIGLSVADAALLLHPLGGPGFAAFVLGQAFLLALFAAASWTRAARGAGASAGPLAGAAAAALAIAALAVRFFEPSLLLAAAALPPLAAATLADRPWARRLSAPLRARAFAAAAAAGAGLAWLAPGLLHDVWLARLVAAYPGGAYLAAADDGTHLWTSFRFSNGTSALLRDGVLQASDSASSSLALEALIGQTPPGADRPYLLLVQPTDPTEAFAVQGDGAAVAIEDGSLARAAAMNALGRDGWRGKLSPPPQGRRPSSALIFAPSPPGAGLRGLADAEALRGLRARLADGAIAGILLPADASPRAVEAAERAAVAAFGAARVADLPHGVLVVAAPASVRLETDADVLLDRLPTSARVAELDQKLTLGKSLRWRAAPSTK
jgi:hypothetical protein